ncbi:PE-PPE domain-containing protein [Mycobacterium talmoniae]|uniref:Putative PPE family protein PPE42 n=1 Tax=Mycobacterium talmoniae TaxID=1858794 RepID=A0A1S1N9D3_9MYCO|nr:MULTISPECIES: PE-PPE domain-containing protein [Mycobacterium]OHU98131.1 hypothetical protein BKN37_21180 [Mycobacterium talmoniae]PQM44897.1 putative PPE family protein PPE42 [Mycobacterium talmoniae]
MSQVLRSVITTSIAMAGAGLIAVAPVPPSGLSGQTRGVLLTGLDADTADTPLGDGAALMVGASGIPTPSQGWMNAYDALYLQPRGFTGTLQAVTTPESLYPFTFPFSETYDRSVSQGVQNVVDAVDSRIAAGGVDPANPIVITGWSQGSTVASGAMSALAAQGVPSDDVHFVILGDPNTPNGGLLERFDVPNGTDPVTVPSLGLTFGHPTPSDLYPADVYNMEYDGVADFPRYPINFLSDLNAYFGMAFNHIAYEGLTPEQIHDAVQLPVSAGSLTDYYIIPSASLPLLDPLRLVPVVGNPLADLLQPDLRVLVNLGYGSITNGWSPGDADVATAMGFLPPQSVLDQVPQALLNGLHQGVQDALKDVLNPANYQLVSPETMTDVLGPILGTLEKAGDLNDPSDFFHFLTAELSGIENWFIQGFSEVSLTHTGIPPIDMASALFTTIPNMIGELFENELAAGNPVAAVGEPVALLAGLVPEMLVGSIF